jgi:predicted ArsR family transcriptional regulator
MGRGGERRIGPAAARVLDALRKGPQTVADIAGPLGVTRNAVRAALSSLVRDGLVREHGLVPGRRRPFRTYARTDAAEVLSGRAYVPLADHLLRAAKAAVPTAQRHELLRAAGRSLAGKAAPGDLPARVRAAARRLEDLGAITTVRRGRDGEPFVIQGMSCPLTAVVRVHPEVCLAVEAFVAGVTRRPAREVCDRTTDTPRCRIEIEA